MFFTSNLVIFEIGRNRLLICTSVVYELYYILVEIKMLKYVLQALDCIKSFCKHNTSNKKFRTAYIEVLIDTTVGYDISTAV